MIQIYVDNETHVAFLKDLSEEEQTEARKGMVKSLKLKIRDKQIKDGKQATEEAS